MAITIEGKYFHRMKMQGMLDMGVFKQIKGMITCLMYVMSYHVLWGSHMAIYKIPAQFNHDIVKGKSI